MGRLRTPQRAVCAAAMVVAGAVFMPAAAQADFGLSEFDVAFVDETGAAALQAGSHPYAMRFDFATETKIVGEAELPFEPTRNLIFGQVPGFVGDQTALPRCPNLNFLELAGPLNPNCPDSTAVGTAKVTIGTEAGKGSNTAALYNLEPSPGQAAKLGFVIQSVPITVDVGIGEDPPHRLLAASRNISQVLEFFGGQIEIWGVPADPAHDPLRGECVGPGGGSTGSCTAGRAPAPFLTLPRACEGPLETTYAMSSWPKPDTWVEGSVLTHDDAVPPNPKGMIGCGKVGFSPRAGIEPTTSEAESSSGLEVSIDVDDEGLKNPAGIAEADIEAILTRFPVGVTLNPSAAEGLGTCSLAQYEAESLATPVGGGCPGASKLGTIEAQTPLLEDHPLRGSVYLAAQDAGNPFGSLAALYLVIRDPELGIFVKQAGRVDTDPASGQIVSLFADLPPFPLEEVSLRLRSGPRAPLVTPPACGTHTTEITLFPSTGAAPLEVASSFQIDSGPGGGPCPAGLPFDPGFEAGTANNAAAAFSPFSMRLARNDGEQDITRFDATLPPGVLARLAGVEKCPDAAIAAAKGKTGRQELASPSCPDASKIGTVLTGAGVGTALTYVPGSLYMAGPVGSAPLSVVAIVPAVAGPFDVGTVVVRQALALDPITSEVKVDSANSDPIPHILEGIPLKVRDIRVNVDRPDFTLNPTSCAEKATLADIWGGGADFLSAADDSPVARDSRFQAASCASLAFKPRLAIKLFGGTRRGDFPALRAIVTPPPEQANFARAAVTLPRSAFLEQGHIRTICTRVQFAAGAGHGSQCPRGAIYGKARAWSPLLDAPAEGPVFLRSSNNKLPDLVVALRGPASAPVDVELSSRIDSVKIGRDGAGIRSIFTGIPDVPVSRFVLAMQGGQKGLIVNSGNLCGRPARNRARANLLGQNGRRYNIKPVVRAVKCAKQNRRKKAKRSSHHSRARVAKRSAVR